MAIETAQSLIRQNPVKTGLFAVLGTLVLGAGLAFSLGFETPEHASAQVTTLSPVTVVAPDHPRLLSGLAGACAAAGANIVDAQIFTTTDGLDDGPDYSPDGKWIYFNSDRTGKMQIWRMHADGTGLEQITKDENNNWFAHPSPDGKWIVFLTYAPDVKGHPPDKDITLRLMPMGGSEITVLASFFGGQGTINVPSWSPDSTQLAYVRYQPKL